MKIVLSIVLGLFLIGCSSETTDKVTKTEVVKVEKSVLDKVVDDVRKIEVPSTEELKATVSKSVESASKAIKSTGSEVVAAVAESIPASLNAKALYASCAGCHGVNAQTKALGKSAIIKGWEVEKTVKALNGYKDGSYGGAMKGLMKGQVSKLSADEINAIAEYIATLENN